MCHRAGSWLLQAGEVSVSSQFLMVPAPALGPHPPTPATPARLPPPPMPPLTLSSLPLPSVRSREPQGELGALGLPRARHPAQLGLGRTQRAPLGRRGRGQLGAGTDGRAKDRAGRARGLARHHGPTVAVCRQMMAPGPRSGRTDSPQPCRGPHGISPFFFWGFIRFVLFCFVELRAALALSHRADPGAPGSPWLTLNSVCGGCPLSLSP